MKIRKFKKGQKLSKSDTIGVIAPSSACDKNRLARGIAFLKAAGFKVKVALNPSKMYGKNSHLFSSDSPKARAKALEDLFADDSVKVIISARGAYGAAELLPLLDFKKLGKTPKIFCGFSDATILLSALNSAGVISVHGPMVSGAFAEDEKNKAALTSVENLLGLLSGEIINPFESIRLCRIKSGKAAEGWLTGGNLSVFAALLGTPWEPQLEQAILFLEETGEKPYRIHRHLLSLKLAGKFDNLSGVIFGGLDGCMHTTGPDVFKVIEDIFKDFKYPVFCGLPAGHEPLNLPVPFGVRATFKDARLVILESALSKN
jgi:muramoyltetrapeptide carboxypeptidase